MRRVPGLRLRCYAAFVNGQPELRSVRETGRDALLAGELWHPKGVDAVRVVHLVWRADGKK